MSAVNWTGLDGPIDAMLADDVPLKEAADRLGVAVSTLSKHLRDRGIYLPLGRKPSPDTVPYVHKRTPIVLRSQWLAPHFEARVDQIMATLSVALRQNGARA